LRDVAKRIIWRFCWGFWGKWRFGVVFLWSGCGELCGKDGFRNAVETVMDFLHEF
jgi:hypothetical protein